MAVLEPVSVGLKFAFLVVLYLFLLWVVRSSLKDLRRDPRASAAPSGPVAPDATALHAAAEGLGPERLEETEALLRVEEAPGLEAQSDGEGDEPLLGAVVEIALDADALGVGGGDDPPAGRAHLRQL